MEYPYFPDCNNLPSRALLRMLNGQKITDKGFEDIHTSYPFWGCIQQLRALGWDIEEELVRNTSSDPNDERITFRRYWLGSETAEWINHDSCFYRQTWKFKMSAQDIEQKSGQDIEQKKHPELDVDVPF